MRITAYDLAQRYVGIKEIKGAVDNPVVMAMLRLDSSWPEHDEVPWCSAYVNWIAWHLRLPRSKSLRARSWLEIGTPIQPLNAVQGFDVVILRQSKDDPDENVIKYRGHVGFFSSIVVSASNYPVAINVLGGNQSNRVSVVEYNMDKFLGIRRLYNE
jgi:uncharacterized protein (TIGR02594 family)